MGDMVYFLVKENIFSFEWNRDENKIIKDFLRMDLFLRVLVV